MISRQQKLAKDRGKPIEIGLARKLATIEAVWWYGLRREKSVGR
jgi:hypothetical protein